MKLAVIVAGAALALGGCAKSVDQRFSAMCAEQEAHDPILYVTSKKMCDGAAMTVAGVVRGGGGSKSS